MRFLSDENIPAKLIRFIRSLNHEVMAIPPSTPDVQIIEKANKEGCVIITLDRDFETLSMFFSFNAILIRISPPYANRLIQAFHDLFKEPKIESIKGLNLLTQSGLIRVS